MPSASRIAPPTYWLARAELALAGNHPADALTYYQTAQAAAAKDPWLSDEHPAILHRARKLWTKAGGTEDGWKAWLEGPSLAREEDFRCVAVRGDWKPASKALPDFTLADSAGRKWTSADFKGQTTFVNVWATWCEPCRSELLQVEKLHQRLKDRPGLSVVTLNLDDNPDLARRFTESNHLTFPVLYGKALYDRLTRELSIPRTWIINRDGVLVKEQVGFDNSGHWLDEALAEIEKTK